MTQLYYVHDPMCSWCWGFRPAWQRLQAAIPDDIVVSRLLGGLAPDSNEPMSLVMQQQIRDTWQRIMQSIPGVEFNFDFWQYCQPRRSTYPSCRAVIAARAQGEQYDQAMTYAIQRAYYLQARNPSDEDTLVELAQELGLDTSAFISALHDAGTDLELQNEIQRARAMHADSFPSLVLEHNGGYWPIAIDYSEFLPMLELIENIVHDT